MTTIFKKTLIAAALAGVGFNAFAADVTSAAASKISKQGSAVAAELDSPVVTVALEAAYAVGDTITLTFTGGLKDAPLTLVSNTSAASAIAPANKLTLGRVGMTATTVTYRVTAVDNSGAVHGILRFGPGVGAADNALATDFANTKLVFTGSAVTALDKVTMTYGATVGNSAAPLDAPVEYNGDAKNTSAPLFESVNEYAIAVDTAGKLNGMLSVQNGRKVFTDGAVAPAYTSLDVLEITATNAVTANDTTPNSTAFTVSGDFSWVTDANKANAVIAKCGAGAVVGDVAAVTETVSATAVTFSCAAPVTAASVLFVTTQDALNDTDPTTLPATAKSINPATFNVSAVQTYDGSKTYNIPAVSGGEWTTDGSIVNVPYMVYGIQNGIQFGQIVNVTNHGGTAGDVYADVWKTEVQADGSLKSVQVLTNSKIGTIAAKSTAKLANALSTKIGNSVFGTYSIRLLTTVPKADVMVYSAYTSNGERVIVNNDSPVFTK